jgi:hypothetical protein
VSVEVNGSEETVINFSVMCGKMRAAGEKNFPSGRMLQNLLKKR